MCRSSGDGSLTRPPSELGKATANETKEALAEEVNRARTLGLAVALGAALGAAMGAATGHMGVWVAAGIAAYIAISVAGTWKPKSNERRSTTNNQ
jgi:uncharacterized membrane protein YoaK (UPF0700 family)